MYNSCLLYFSIWFCVAGYITVVCMPWGTENAFVCKQIYNQYSNTQKLTDRCTVILLGGKAIVIPVNIVGEMISEERFLVEETFLQYQLVMRETLLFEQDDRRAFAILERSFYTYRLSYAIVLQYLRHFEIRQVQFYFACRIILARVSPVRILDRVFVVQFYLLRRWAISVIDICTFLCHVASRYVNN